MAGKGFGVSQSDAKKKINQKKGIGKDVYQSEEKDAVVAIYGSDSAVPPEQMPPRDSTPDVGTTTPPVDSRAEDAAGMVTLTPAELRAIVENERSTALATQEDTLTRALRERDRAQAEKDRLEQIFAALGRPTPAQGGDSLGLGSNGFPMVNTRSSRSDRMLGAAADFANILENVTDTPRRHYVNSANGEQFVQRDYRNLTRFYRKNKDQIRADMEKWVRGIGLLQGWKTWETGDASTLKTDIPAAFLVYLSTVLRETHTSRFVFWQFTFNQLELGKGPGDTIQVARFRYLPEPTSLADRTLTPGTATNSSNQPLTLGTTQNIVLQELGLGKDAANAALAIPEFISAYSLLSLETAMQTRLGHDYYATEDIAVRSLLAASTRVVYNNGGSITTAPTDVAAGKDGTMTEEFLNALYSYMSSQKIPAMDDGCFVLVLHTTALGQLKNSLSSKNRYLDKANLEDITNILLSATNGDLAKVSGYQGTVCGFHIFETNAISLGAPGTEGAQTETLGAGALTTRTSYAMGRAAIARATGMPMEIRRDNNDDFGRLNRYIWISHEAFAGLDVDPAVSADQQLRVIKVNTVDSAV